MSVLGDNGMSAAIAALFTIGMALLNYGLVMIQGGKTQEGVIVLAVGVILIFVAAFLIKYFVVAIVRRTWKV